MSDARSRLPTRRAVTLALLLLPAACDFTVYVGAGEIPQIDVVRSYALGDVDLSACPAGDYSIRDAASGQLQTVVVEHGSGGACDLSFTEPNVLLFDDAQAQQAKDALGSRNVEVRSAVLIVKSFSVTDENGAPLSVGDGLSSLTVLVDDVPVFGDADLPRLERGDLVVQLPDELVSKVEQAVKDGDQARAKVAARLEFSATEMASLPRVVHLEMHLQPEVELGVPLF